MRGAGDEGHMAQGAGHRQEGGCSQQFPCAWLAVRLGVPWQVQFLLSRFQSNGFPNPLFQAGKFRLEVSPSLAA